MTFHIYRDRRISPCLLILVKMAGCVSWSLEIWARHGVESGVLPGEIVQDQKEEFEFRCDDSVMGSRGGTYHFKLLTMEKYREHRRGWYEDHEEVLKHCQASEMVFKTLAKSGGNGGNVGANE